jgi:hypothetical protein
MLAHRQVSRGGGRRSWNKMAARTRLIMQRHLIALTILFAGCSSSGNHAKFEKLYRAAMTIETASTDVISEESLAQNLEIECKVSFTRSPSRIELEMITEYSIGAYYLEMAAVTRRNAARTIQTRANEMFQEASDLHSAGIAAIELADAYYSNRNPNIPDALLDLAKKKVGETEQKIPQKLKAAR